MSSISDVFDRYPNAALGIEADGPPHYESGRIIISGTAESFRMLAAVLTTMAEAVEDHDHPASRHGWSLVLRPCDVPQLRMPDASLSLHCDPDAPPQ